MNAWNWTSKVAMMYQVCVHVYLEWMTFSCVDLTWFLVNYHDSFHSINFLVKPNLSMQNHNTSTQKHRMVSNELMSIYRMMYEVVIWNCISWTWDTMSQYTYHRSSLSICVRPGNFFINFLILLYAFFIYFFVICSHVNKCQIV